MRKLCLILVLCLLPLLAAAEPLTLLVASDLHFISPELTDYGEMFMQSVRSGDGKLAEYGPELLDALIAEAISRRVDAVVLTGDLTYNGERRSLEVLAERLARVEIAGIPVYVIPGNHDIAYPYAAVYDGGKAYPTTQITGEDFRRICNRFGYQEAISRDAASCSYVVRLNGGTWLLCLDANTEAAPGAILPETLTWAEAQLQAARDKGVRVISATHQNVQLHNARFQGSYLIENYAEVGALLRRYGVTTNLSGHMHATHTSTVDGLTDHATGSLSVAPLRFAILTLDGEQTTYTLHRLPILQDEAAERFAGRTRPRMMEALAEAGVPEAIRERMTDYFISLNAAYFGGEMPEGAMQTEEWQLWEQYGQATSWWSYMISMVQPVE